MHFHSYLYLFLFLPIVLLLYHLFRKGTLGKIILLVSSYIFYGWFTLWFLIPLLISSFLDYFLGLRLHASDDPRMRKLFLVLSCAVNLGMLSLFKYTGWLTQMAHNAALSVGWTIPVVTLVLPPGISFYTFQTMSYTFSVYQKKRPACRNLLDYLNYVTFFPQLVAGPIERSDRLLPQISKIRPCVSLEQASAAIFLIFFGLFQKLVLADNLGALVETISRHYASDIRIPGSGLLFAYAFAGQIYCDFSAYTNIARGTGKLFNIDLMRNFRTPYFAANPSEFWNRWHISLSSWLRDYLYIPLGGGLRGKWMTLRNLMMTMFLGGLWHGAGFLFIAWGFFHGLLLIIYRLLPLDQILIRRLGRVGKYLAIIIFFHLVCFGWILFRTPPEQLVPLFESLQQIPSMFTPSSLASFAGWYRHNSFFTYMLYGIVLFSLPILITDVVGYKIGSEFGDIYSRIPTWLRVLIILAFFYGIVFFGRREANEFIYFAF